MRLKFSPQRDRKVLSTAVSVPVVQAVVRRGSSKTLPMRLLVDSGASVCIFSWLIAKSLGIEQELSAAPSIELTGLGGVSAAKHAVVDLEIADKMYIVGVVAFFMPNTTTVATYDGLLGQIGFFDKVRFVQRHEHPVPYFYIDG